MAATLSMRAFAQSPRAPGSLACRQEQEQEEEEEQEEEVEKEEEEENAEDQPLRRIVEPCFLWMSCAAFQWDDPAQSCVVPLLTPPEACDV